MQKKAGGGGSPVPFGVLQPLDEILSSSRLQVFAVVVGERPLRMSLHVWELDGFGGNRVFIQEPGRQRQAHLTDGDARDTGCTTQQKRRPRVDNPPPI